MKETVMIHIKADMLPQIFESHKRVKASPMGRKYYNDYRGWDLPDDEDGTDEGYLIEYLDGGKPNDDRHEGYISWSPKAQFDEGYTAHSTGSINFGQAMEELKRGGRVARKGWNGADMFIYHVPANSYPAQTEVAKEYFGKNSLVPYRAYIAIKTADGDVATWAPSTSDALADDWQIIE